jgi:cytochrome oxidase Cu insertion factor (SCO1/SenC/PrrC family)
VSKRGAVVLIVIMVFVFGVFAGIFNAVTVEDDKQAQREREWLQFSQQHHCRIVREDSFTNPTTLWQCDGNFQVRR